MDFDSYLEIVASPKSIILESITCDKLYFFLNFTISSDKSNPFDSTLHSYYIPLFDDASMENNKFIYLTFMCYKLNTE